MGKNGNGNAVIWILVIFFFLVIIIGAGCGIGFGCRRGERFAKAVKNGGDDKYTCKWTEYAMGPSGEPIFSPSGLTFANKCKMCNKDCSIQQPDGNWYCNGSPISNVFGVGSAPDVANIIAEKDGQECPSEPLSVYDDPCLGNCCSKTYAIDPNDKKLKQIGGVSIPMFKERCIGGPGTVSWEQDWQNTGNQSTKFSFNCPATETIPSGSCNCGEGPGWAELCSPLPTPP